MKLLQAENIPENILGMRLIVILSKELITEFIKTNDHFADILTKFLRGSRIHFICSKLGAYNLYAPASEGVIK